MADLNTLLKELAEVCANPRKQLDKYIAEGKKVVGCFPVYTPEELVHAGGMIPMGLWGGQITPSVAGKYNPIFTCSIMRSCMEYGMTGVYKGLTCAMMPMLCDTFRGMSAAWRSGVKDIPLVSLIHPQNRTDSGAFEFMVEEYKATKANLEKVTGCQITDEALAKTIELYNEHSAAMMKFAEVANDHLDVITPVARHNVFKSALFMEKGEHLAKMKELIAALEAAPKYEHKGKKVVLTGVTAEPDEFLDLFTECGIAVVGDDLAQESRLYRTPIPTNHSTPIENLAAQWFDRKGCSMVHEVHSTRGTMLVDMAKKNGAQGIAVCLMRFCDVEEYDYPMIAQAAKDAGLTCLCLEIDQSTQNNEQSHTKIQSFAEM